MIPIGSPVRVINDRTNYTRGCFKGCDGVVRLISEVELTTRPPLLLYYVEITSTFPIDPYENGGWWYRRSELHPL